MNTQVLKLAFALGFYKGEDRKKAIRQYMDSGQSAKHEADGQDDNLGEVNRHEIQKEERHTL